jgi:enamine deaminase RidA (YjgF/YER057c/UK114 family)
MEQLNPPGWPRPRGYANGVAATGRSVFVAGQVGWDASGAFVSDELVGQTRQALRNCLDVLAEAGGGPEHVARMTWYVVDRADYAEKRRELGAVYRELMGDSYPAMSLLEVRLLEPAALVEIEVTAVVPEKEPA